LPQVITLKGNIRVLARIRPLLEKERTAACSSSSSSSDGAPDAGLRALDEERVLLSGPAAGQQREWEFDRVFGPQHDQAAVYSEVSGLVCSIMDGYSGCVIAYGQTGSGKTHTVEGEQGGQGGGCRTGWRTVLAACTQWPRSPHTPSLARALLSGPVDNPGINSRALTEMFTITRQRAREVTYALSASVLEIYQESLFDLLAGNKDTGAGWESWWLPVGHMQLPPCGTRVCSQSVLTRVCR
jgi:kinesin family protein C2/C3